MAAIVCPGYQPCLDSRIHSFRLLSPKPLTPHQPIDLPFKSCFLESNSQPRSEENVYKNDTKNGGWSSIESLSNVSQGHKEATYVHPLVKHSSVRLSAKSLELCTENLGNETGTEIIESGTDFLSWENYGESKEKKSCQVLRSKKVKTKNFPPPLTTMRGSESLRVRPHREGGRLVIEATKVPSSASCFRTERSHGRLRLSFWTHPKDNDNDEQQEQEQEREREKEEECVELSPTSDNNIAIPEFIKTPQPFSHKLASTTENESTSNSNLSVNEDGVRIMEKYERRRSCRCKEGDNENNELLIIKNWGQRLWVASS